MVHQGFIFFALVLGAFAAPQNFAGKEIPAKGDNGEVGGIFGLSAGTKRPSLSSYVQKIRLVARTYKISQVRQQEQAPSPQEKTRQKHSSETMVFQVRAHTQLSTSQTTP
jgi:hypothetical protein